MAKTQSLTLHNGVEMPILGLGTWESEDGDEAYNAVKAALELGYRHIDTAMIYRNEESVGRAIHDSDVPRDEIFVVTKLWNDDQGYESGLAAFDESMEKLGLETLDLYLIHWPKHQDRRIDTWKALEKLYADGRVRAIGVSNYMSHHMEELLDNCEIVPMVNQIELHAFNYGSRTDIVNLCDENDIAVTAYSPLARAERLDNPTLNEIADKHGQTVAQIMLRWLMQQDIIVIPKSVNRGRIEENGEIFDFQLDDDDMQAIHALDESLFTVMDATKIP